MSTPNAQPPGPATPLITAATATPATATDADPAADPAAAPAAPASRWDRMMAVLPGLTTLSQFLLVTLVGTFAKCSVDDYTRDMERIKQVSTFNEVLADSPSVRAVTRQNLSLVTLDHMLKASPKAWPLSLLHKWGDSADDSLVFSIAEEVYRARLATQSDTIDNTLVLGRLGVAGRIMQRRDKGRYREFLASVRQSVSATKVISTPDAKTVQVQPASAALPISPVNLPLAKAITAHVSIPRVQRVYIQFRGYNDSVAQGLQKLFVQEHWKAPDVDPQQGTYGCVVRYYYADDTDRAREAQQLTQAYLKSLRGQPTPSTEVTLHLLDNSKFPGVPRRQVEVWISSK